MSQPEEQDEPPKDPAVPPDDAASVLHEPEPETSSKDDPDFADTVIGDSPYSLPRIEIPPPLRDRDREFDGREPEFAAPEPFTPAPVPHQPEADDDTSFELNEPNAPVPFGDTVKLPDESFAEGLSESSLANPDAERDIPTTIGSIAADAVEPPADHVHDEPHHFGSMFGSDPGGSVASGASATTGRTYEAPPDRTFLWLVFLGTYAATATVALLYLYMRLRSGGGANQLESLPDLKPVKEVAIFNWSSPVPAGHTLALGEKTRFGDVVVEPIRITKGPLSFQYYSGDAGKQRPPSADVLKLWLRVTNVSKDRTVAPLDGELLFPRRVGQRSGDVVSNNFVHPVGSAQPMVMMFDFPKNSLWEPADSGIGQQLAPGESAEVFIPSTEEGWRELSGDLVWRVLIRKGYSTRGNGVTTLVDFRFKDDDITADPAA